MNIFSLYLAPSLGMVRYMVDEFTDGAFVASDIGISKDIFFLTINIFYNFKRDIINSTDISTFGVSLGL
jgi:hypothetical protein